MNEVLLVLFTAFISGVGFYAAYVNRSKNQKHHE